MHRKIALAVCFAALAVSGCGETEDPRFENLPAGDAATQQKAVEDAWREHEETVRKVQADLKAGRMTPAEAEKAIASSSERLPRMKEEYLRALSERNPLPDVPLPKEP